MEPIRMSVERRRMLVERERTERERRAVAKGTRSCQERYFYCKLNVVSFEKDKNKNKGLRFKLFIQSNKMEWNKIKCKTLKNQNQRIH